MDAWTFFPGRPLRGMAGKSILDGSEGGDAGHDQGGGGFVCAFFRHGRLDFLRRDGFADAHADAGTAEAAGTLRHRLVGPENPRRNHRCAALGDQETDAALRLLDLPVRRARPFGEERDEVPALERGNRRAQRLTREG